MQAIHETETYLDEIESEIEETVAPAPSGARRVLRLALILLLLIIASALFFFVLLPAIQNMIQAPLPAFSPCDTGLVVM